MKPEYIREVREYVAEMHARGRKGDMFAEAQGQWLDSCLECAEQYDDNLLDDVEGDALFWLDGHMSNYHHDSEELSPGGIYHWMVIATEQAEDWER